MYERILVPLDGSKVGEAALPHIENLASKLIPETEVEITLLQVITSLEHYVTIRGAESAYVPYTQEELNQIKKKAEDYLDKAGDSLRAKGAVVKCEVRTGHAAEEIIKAAQETNADLVAMSTHGRSGIGRWGFGSVTDKVLRGANIPVLVVRAPKAA
ncbi:MAG: universal stress protein [Dehalococcoidales bacterium]